MVLGKMSQRKQQVLDLLIEDSGISVADISKILGVSVVTVRSDLNQLSESGYIVRTRGGAQPLFHPNIIGRQRSQADEKARIAKAAAALVNDGDYIMIDGGTTTSMVAKYLLGKRDVTIVTNSTLVLSYARMNPALKVILVGGEFRPSAEAIVGPTAVEEIKKYRVTRAFLGTDGFSETSGFTAHSVEAGEVVRQMAAQTSEAYMLSDSSKYGEAGFAHILHLSDVHSIIIDSNLSKEAQTSLKDAGAHLCVV